MVIFVSAFWLQSLTAARIAAQSLGPPPDPSLPRPFRVYGSLEAYDNIEIPPQAGQFTIIKVFDGVDWSENRTSLASGGHLTIWVTGLPAEADLTSTELYAGNQRIPLTFVGPVLEDGARQLNAQLVTILRPGPLGIYVRHGMGVSNIVGIEVGL